MRFTALLHHVTIDLLRESFFALKRSAAPGVDRVTWQQYQEGLEERLMDLHRRVHSGTYRAQPSRRVFIPKADGRERPIGIASLEDKLVQRAVVTVLEAIHEEDFLGFSYGFRPGRSQHDALDSLWVGLARKRVRWILDADIQVFFDTISHEWLLKFIEHRVADPRILRLIQKWLRAGVSEQGARSKTTVGTPQGSVASPFLANVYLHYVFDLWAHQWRKKHATGEVILVRYADDFVVGFQNVADARRFLADLRERLKRFSLCLHANKTRLIEFGRYAQVNRQQRGLGKPETFDFLGFTHICGKPRNGEGYLLRRQTIKARLRAKLQVVKTTLMKYRHTPVSQQGQWLGSVVRGYYQYHAISGNLPAMEAFRTQVIRGWLFALRRRSQRSRLPVPSRAWVVLCCQSS
ncbi:MAG: group II intron reverse transcriptase/maturase [Gemmatales bacterium]